MAQREDLPKKTKTEATEDQKNTHIPTMLHEEILLRLPVDALLKLKLVCKDWLRLISSPKFIQKHLNRSKARRDVTRILMTLPSAITDYNYYASEDGIGKRIPYPRGFYGTTTTILGSYDGLICLLDRCSPRKIGVFNPSTGKSDHIRIADGGDFLGMRFYWFGRNPCTGEYVLVIGYLWVRQRQFVLNYIPPGTIIKVYNFSCKLKCVLSCTMIQLVFCYQEIGILLHGNLHWSVILNIRDASRTQEVLAYDFQENKMRRIPGPPRPTNCICTLGVVDRCLCAILQPGEMFEMWIMKEYGVEKSWMKYRNIEGYFKCHQLIPLGFFRNGDRVRQPVCSQLKKCSFDGKEAILLYEDYKPNIYDETKAIVCDDSLVSPAVVWGE